MTGWNMSGGRRFQSTFPSRGTTSQAVAVFCLMLISIHVPLAGNDNGDYFWVRNYGISIHVPLAGNDFQPLIIENDAVDFNPRSPRGERREYDMNEPEHELFQSTFPSRGTTVCGKTIVLLSGDFNPRSPRGERQYQPRQPRGRRNISIHVPLAGND